MELSGLDRPLSPAISGDPEGLWHTVGGEVDEVARGQGGFDLLAVEGAGLQAWPDDRLVAAHRRLGEGAPLVAGLLFPGLAACAPARVERSSSPASSAAA